jgi:hypothetical protein
MAETEDRPFEISYWEALRAWWRIYWPTQLASTFVLALLSRLVIVAVNAARAERPLEKSLLEERLPVFTVIVSFLLGALLVWLFAPRTVGRPYRGFRLVCARSSESSAKMTGGERRSLWFFIWWRQFAGGLAATLLAMPLNMMLSTTGIRAGSEVAALIGLFAVGPIVMKMLVGHPFPGFQIEARRSAQHDAAPDAGAAA